LPDPGPASGSDLGRSVVLYPLVGLVIGLLVWGFATVLRGLDISDEDLAAVLVLVAWVWLTGGLHLDGLADSADAWVGGLGDKGRTLDIMKDPRSGPFGVMALVLVLLCKWTAISTLIASGAAFNLVWIPVLARAELSLLCLRTPYARPEGIGAELRGHLPRTAAGVGPAIALIACALFLGASALALAAAGGTVFVLWRRFMVARLGGFTGDTAGALVELSEAFMLATGALFL
jgi:adenosylcobinamide-GDP ribazoletransferase